MSDSESTCLGKRQRIEIDQGTPPPSRRHIKQEPAEDWVDDEDFYLPDGDVTILAERKRFKVRACFIHREYNAAHSKPHSSRVLSSSAALLPS